jgi:lipopolysaccharide export system protein LptA
MDKMIKRFSTIKKRLLSRKGAMGWCLLLFFFLVMSIIPSFAKKEKVRPNAGKIILRYADRVEYDQIKNPNVQIFVGHVSFSHNGLILYCDSANFYQLSNSFQAFGNVRMLQGDTLSLKSEYLFYDGNSQIAQARKKVILKNRSSELFTDSLNYDRVYHIGYFFEGGKLIDGGNILTSDWGQYNTSDKQALFNYHVELDRKDMKINSDTIHYDTRTKVAHLLGPSNVLNGTSHIYTENGYYNTLNKNVTLMNRSVVVDKNQQMVADSLIYDQEKGVAHAYRNIVYNDKANKNILTGDYCYHNEKTGYTITYNKAEVKNYSEKDTLYLHADTFKIYTYDQKTDSVYRVIHGYYHARSFRSDLQSVADSLSYNSKKAVLSLYGNPIVWNGMRQILGEEIHAYMNDSTIDSIHVVNQALMVEKLDSLHFNQISGKEMRYFFENGKLKENRVNNNVQVIYYAFDSDSIMVGMNYTETSLARMFMGSKKLSKIWTKEATGTFYPLAFVSKEKSFLPNYGWFDYIRPVNKDDIFEWRSKTAGKELKQTVRRKVPFQTLKNIK